MMVRVRVWARVSIRLEVSRTMYTWSLSLTMTLFRVLNKNASGEGRVRRRMKAVGVVMEVRAREPGCMTLCMGPLE